MAAPYVFTRNTKIKSAEVNANFAAIGADQITNGVLGTARLGTGTATAARYLAGDSTWRLLQAGQANNNSDGSLKTVTFPIAFSVAPTVILTSFYNTVKNYPILTAVTATTFSFYCVRADNTGDVGGTSGAETINWLAIQ